MTRTALISVYNKDGIAEFAKELADLGFKILASGGTAKELSSAGIEVTDIASTAGEPILGHRVVTLSREIHAGLLARDTDEDRMELKQLGIPWIDLVCVDLYPLSEEIAKWQQLLSPSDVLGDSPLARGEEYRMAAKAAVLEKTDIGGPTMLRSAAKGRRIVICDPADRQAVISWLKIGEPDKENFISSLAAKAEFIVADYCLASARYHSAGKFDGLLGEEIAACKYGENAYQAPAGLYTTPPQSPPKIGGEVRGGYDPLSLDKFKLLAGAAPSYNNWADVDRLLQTITHIAAGFDVNPSLLPTAIASSSGRLAATVPQRGKGIMNIALGVKHGNPCGAAIGDNPSSVIKKMLEGDLRAIFGGLVMVNFPIDEKLAGMLLTHKMASGQRRLLDGIITPKFSQAAIEMLKRKGDKCRFLVNPALANLSKDSLDHHHRFRYVRGGFLAQPNYDLILDFKNPSMEKNPATPASREQDMLLAWAIGSTSNSNTVTIVKDGQLLGNGVGQQDRVGCCQLAIRRAIDAGHQTKGAVAYSDSFFPFVDGPEVLAKAGICAIIATSGSVRDGEIKKFCKDKNISLYLLPDSLARGFFGH